MAKSHPSSLRLFLALDLPAGARADIAAWRAPLVGDLRPVAAGSLHVTLVFLGWRGQEDVRRIAAVAQEAAAGKRAVSLAPTGVRGVPRRSPRLFALELEDRGGRCASLQSSLASSLAEAGLHMREKRPFWPHLTLARVRGGHAAEPLEAERLPAPLVADRVVLFRSVLSPQGAAYEPLWTGLLDR
ncbi:MAG: RNA 2',3'-cyclic phosphodiesterase [Actinomycetota bacterium]|nr:RNA 2',3'-cyclic phosphodiesterase [Actinomycetota bacterium]MDQ3720171.1 RNA 2',3'-cyclic phosphodiesterase [Actinomycetota bacterium]